MGAEFGGQLPVVVDEQLGAAVRAGLDAALHFAPQHGVPGRIRRGRRLDAQLHGGHAGRHDLRHPLGAVDDGVQVEPPLRSGAAGVSANCAASPQDSRGSKAGSCTNSGSSAPGSLAGGRKVVAIVASTAASAATKPLPMAAAT